MKKYLGLLIYILCFYVQGTPDKISVYFLSAQVATGLLENTVSLKLQYAFNDSSCVQMGDHCFHPQHGVVTRENAKKVKKEYEVPRYESLQLEDVSQIKCSKGYHFDVFCGKEKKAKSERIKLSVWLDNSSSMRKVDMENKEGYCERRHIASSFLNQCGERVSFNTFNTGRKQVGSAAYVCTDHGTNDGKKLVKWIKSNDTKHLVIVTDVDEYTGELRDFLDQNGARIYGIGTKPLYASSLMSMMKPLLKTCL